MTPFALNTLDYLHRLHTETTDAARHVELVLRNGRTYAGALVAVHRSTRTTSTAGDAIVLAPATTETYAGSIYGPSLYGPDVWIDPAEVVAHSERPDLDDWAERRSRDPHGTKALRAHRASRGGPR